MNQPTMTNEQFALWIAIKMERHVKSYTEMAEEYYEWLESKKLKQGEIKYYRNGIEIPNPHIVTTVPVNTTIPEPDMSKPPTLHNPKDHLG